MADLTLKTGDLVCHPRSKRERGGVYRIEHCFMARGTADYHIAWVLWPDGDLSSHRFAELKKVES